MHYQVLNDRIVIALSGEDVFPFLQGLVTNDVDLLKNGELLYAALLSPQGKFLHDFFLLQQGDAIWLDVNIARADDLLARFRLYKLRSRVAFTLQPDIAITASWGEGATGKRDPRLSALGCRQYGEFVSPADAHTGDYEAHRIMLAMFDGAKDMVIDKSLLLEFGFEEVHGVSFSKGCYVGQEVTARSKFRGQVKKHLYHVKGAKVLKHTGSPITLQGEVVGELRSTHDNMGLAIVRSEAVEQANKNSSLMVGDISLEATLPTWVIKNKTAT